MKLTTLMLAALLGTGIAAAQGYYDDDIYFDASKAKKAVKTTKRVSPGQSEYASFAAADTYTPTGTSTRSVDEYNRRGIFAPVAATDTISVDSLYALGDFSYTRRIERFHNPDVIVENPDDGVAELYYSTSDDPINVNIYVNSPGYWGWGYPYYYDPFWYGSPAWAWGPSWSWGWGPSWSWSWGWGPSWSWGWGPSWGWGWGGPSWGWNPGPPPPVHRPSHGTRPGAGNTHFAGSYRRPAGSNRGPSGSNWNVGNVGSRPNGSTSNGNHSGTQYRPGAGNSSSYRGNATNNRNNNTNNSYRRSNNTNMNRNSNTNTYRNSNSGSFRSGSTGGSFRGGAGGGSMRGGGGGGSRGGGGRR